MRVIVVSSQISRSVPAAAHATSRYDPFGLPCTLTRPPAKVCRRSAAGWVTFLYVTFTCGAASWLKPGFTACQDWGYTRGCSSCSKGFSPICPLLMDWNRATIALRRVLTQRPVPDHFGTGQRFTSSTHIAVRAYRVATSYLGIS